MYALSYISSLDLAINRHVKLRVSLLHLVAADLIAELEQSHPDPVAYKTIVL
jgi:hypothetical protein